MQESIRGCDVFLIQPTCPPVNDSLMELLVMIDACRRASARSITAVIPYFGYARADRKSQGRESIAAKLVANMITEAGDGMHLLRMAQMAGGSLALRTRSEHKTACALSRSHTCLSPLDALCPSVKTLAAHALQLWPFQS